MSTSILALPLRVQLQMTCGVQVLHGPCRSGLIVYSTMLDAKDLSNGALLDLGRPVHDAATVGLPSLDDSEQGSGL